MKLSVTIITFNEERNIERAIRSVSFADEVIVVDSGSTDKTCQIATSLGAKVSFHPFAGYGQQKNYAASLSVGEWVLNIDADEEVTPLLRDSILATIKGQTSNYLFKVSRRNNYCGKWITHGGWYPDRKTRLCKRGEAGWSEPQVHEELLSITPTEIINLKGDLNHYSFPTIKSQIQTNLRYASLGSLELRQNKGRPSLLSVFLKPLGKFVECYFLKLGFLDGLYGLVIAINASHSLFLKYIFAYTGEHHD